MPGSSESSDPDGCDDDFNLYAYVKNDPLNKTDPTGMCESISTCQMEREERAVLGGEMSPEQYQENNAYRAAGAGAGLAILATRGSAAPAIAKAFRSRRFERRMEKTVSTPPTTGLDALSPVR